jgi:hypothetical protein
MAAASTAAVSAVASIAGSTAGLVPSISTFISFALSAQPS